MESEPTIRRFLVSFVIIAGLVLLLYAAFFAWGHRIAVLQLFQTKEYKINLPGKIFLSLSPDNGSAPSGIYAYVLASGSLDRIFADISNKVPSYYVNTSPTPSNDGTLLTFVRKGNTDSVPQIYVAAPSGADVRSITATPESIKRGPVLSPAKDFIAFEASADKGIYGSETGGTPGDWGVYLTDMSGNSLRVATGTNPLFSSDGKELLILQNDGLHLFDIRKPQKPNNLGLVLPLSEPGIYRWASVSLSHDGSHIAWAIPSMQKVSVARITSWGATISVVLEKEIPLLAYHAVFSPDGTQLALEEERPSPGKISSYIIISIYDLTSGKLQDAINLNKYTNSLIRLGGWVE